MRNDSQESGKTIFRLHMSEFWSGDLGLTLVSVSLVILIFLIQPLRAEGERGRLFFDLLMVILMVSGALTIKQHRAFTAITIFIVILGLAMLWISHAHPTPFYQRLSSAMSILALLLYVRIVLLVMFREGPITWSRLQGGVSAYLLIGLAWGTAFRLIEEVHAGSFHFVNQPANVDDLTAKLVYFSFATLTTVGFGDVLPLHPMARSLAIAEAVVGQLFPAILIGTLVGMAMQSRPKP
jgi:hypothetical protein